MSFIEQQLPRQEAGFPYAQGTTRELLAEMAERRADTGLQQQLEDYFRETVGVGFSFSELHDSMFTTDPGGNRGDGTPQKNARTDSLEIQLATHLAKPDINTLSVAMAVELLQEAGYPVRFTIRTLPDDVYIDATKDESGIKPSCVTLPLAAPGGRIQLQPLVAEETAQAKRLQAIQLPDGTTLDAYTAWLTQAAGVRASIIDGSAFHRRWLECFLASGAATRDKEFKKSRLFLAQADGTRTAIDPVAATTAYQNGTPTERAVLAERLSPSADMYYRLVPMYLAGFVGGQRILMENYDDDPAFVKRITSGIGKIQAATGARPAVARTTWLCGLDQGNNPIYQGAALSWESTYTSLTIPGRLVGNLSLQRAYRQYVTEAVVNQVGDPGSLSLSELQKATLMATVGFLETDTYNQ